MRALFTWNPKTQISGSVIAIDRSKIVGWAANLPNPRIPLQVRLRVDGVIVATATADQKSDLLSAALCSACANGFSFAIPASVNDGAYHVLTLEAFSSSTTSGASLVIGNHGYASGGSVGFTLTISDTDDTVFGSSSRDVIMMMGGSDWVEGGDGADDLNGNVGDDHVDGGAGDDTLHGGKGNDTVIGGAGRDYMAGDLGDDLLLGGADDDTYYYALNNGNDTIDDTTGANVFQCDGVTASVLKGSPDAVISIGAGKVTFKGTSFATMRFVSCGI